jgi:putative molybdopterin biosynthesis protein
MEVVPDDPAALKDALRNAIDTADMVVINAGSSAGSEDYTHKTIDALGDVIIDGVNMKPGKPVILGIVRGRPVIGVPGFPVAAELAFRLFGRPIIYAMQGLVPPKPDTVTATLSRQLASSLGPTEFVRVKLGRVGETLVATPLPRGSGRLMSLVHSDGVICIPPEMEGLAAGTETEVELTRPLSDIEGTVVCIGSHDNALDLLSDFLKRTHPEYSLSSAHVGSLGGLMALKRGEAHMAGCHLLDEETGEYNVPYIRKYLEGVDVTLLNLAYRTQGLMVRPGNPLNISGIADIGREGVRFVNRQRGAGTRILLDLELKKLGIGPDEVAGYPDEEYTHMGIAVAVASGKADVGLGILAAAKALGLDFIPVADERYDIAVPTGHMRLERVAALLDIMRNDTGFKTAVESLGGYDTRDMGEVMHETGGADRSAT